MAFKTVHIEGLKELQAELHELPDKIGKQVLRRAVRDGAKLWLIDLRARVSIVTSRLRAALAIASKFRKNSFSAWVGATNVSERAHILRFLERGTGQHLGARTGKLSARSARFARQGKGIAPRRWIEQSYDAKKNAVLALVNERLAKYIARYKAKHS